MLWFCCNLAHDANLAHGDWTFQHPTNRTLEAVPPASGQSTRKAPSLKKRRGQRQSVRVTALVRNLQTRLGATRMKHVTQKLYAKNIQTLITLLRPAQARQSARASRRRRWRRRCGPASRCCTPTASDIQCSCLRSSLPQSRCANRSTSMCYTIIVFLGSEEEPSRPQRQRPGLCCTPTHRAHDEQQANRQHLQFILAVPVVVGVMPEWPFGTQCSSRNRLHSSCWHPVVASKCR